MEHNQERQQKLRLFRVRSSQPPGRDPDALKERRGPEHNEVKGVSPESEPQPRERLKFGERPILCRRAQAKWTRATETSPCHTPGVTDSIELGGGYGTPRRTRRLLGDELPEYSRATLTGSPEDGSSFGMGTGLARKRGNSRGVKVPTNQSPLKGKHRRYAENETADGN